MSLRNGAAAALDGLFGSTSAFTRELMTSDAVLRAPLALSRRIGFVQLRGGVGASSLAGYTTSLLARRRAGLVLAVNASGGPRHLLWQSGATGSLLGTRDRLRRAHARTSLEARAGLATTPAGAYALDLAEHGIAAGPGTWFEQVTPIARFYDIVCTDWGVRDWRVDLRQVAAASHVICLVARADRYAAEQAAALVDALGQIEDQPRVVLALVDVGHTAGRTPQILGRRVPGPVLTIPYEPRRAAARPLASRRLPTPSRLAHIRLATTLLEQAHATDLTRRRLVDIDHATRAELAP